MPNRTLFVGSSSEGLEIAQAVQSNLESDAEVRVWSQDVFLPGEHVLDSLLKQIQQSEFAVLVFAPDDLLEIRGAKQVAVRDNVLFELGLCVGRLGPKRSFIVKPARSEIRIPSDLLGVNAATFEPNRSDGDLVAALGPACNKIRKAIRAPNEYPLEPVLRLPVLLRKESLTPRMLDLLVFIELEEPCTRNQLAAQTKYDEAELYYRLEYLQLLSLVKLDERGADPGEDVFRLNPDYAKVRGGLGLPPRSAYASTLPTCFNRRREK